MLDKIKRPGSRGGIPARIESALEWGKLRDVAKD